MYLFTFTPSKEKRYEETFFPRSSKRCSKKKAYGKEKMSKDNDWISFPDRILF